MKTCRTCEEEKPTEDFPKAGANGRQSQCKPCWATYMRDWHAKNPRAKRMGACRRYGITVDQYDAMLEEQGGACAMCGEEESIVRKNGQVQSLSIDHDHATGRVRGLLCSACNIMIGKARDDVARLENGIRYLNAHKVS